MMEGLMGCNNDSESVTYFERILDELAKRPGYRERCGSWLRRVVVH